MLFLFMSLQHLFTFHLIHNFTEDIILDSSYSSELMSSTEAVSARVSRSNFLRTAITSSCKWGDANFVRIIYNLRNATETVLTQKRKILVDLLK